MKITCTFETYEEFLAFTAGKQQTAEKAVKKEAVEKEEPAPQEPEQPAEVLPSEEEKPAVDITVVRKTLTKLNKAMGKNVAKELIKEFGVTKLTEISADDLPALLAKAEGMLDA